MLAPMKTPIESTAFSSTITPSTTSERAPMKQLSSMMVGFACSGSSTPPMPTPPDRCTFLPIWAQLPDRRPGVDHRAFVDVGADVHVGGHQHDVLRDVGAAAGDCGRARRGSRRPRNPRRVSRRTWSAPCRSTASMPPGITRLSCSRNESSTAFLSHWCVCHLPSIFSATRSSPRSSRAIAASTASRDSRRRRGRGQVRRVSPTRLR